MVHVLTVVASAGVIAVGYVIAFRAPALTIALWFCLLLLLSAVYIRSGETFVVNVLSDDHERLVAEERLYHELTTSELPTVDEQHP